MAVSEFPRPTEYQSVEDILELQREAIAGLMRSQALARGDVDHALSEATEAAARLLGVRRASVWMLDDARTYIECADMFDLGTGVHTKGARLFEKDAPHYFAAAVQERCIVAHDARTDPRTSEFAAGYLEPNGISAMLDAPVVMHGKVVGVVCHEHVGPARRWHAREELLAGTLADFVGMALLSARNAAQAHELGLLSNDLERRVEERTRELAESRENVRILFETSPVALLVTRVATDEVTSANARAVELFEVPPAAVRGVRAPDFYVDLDVRARLLELLRDRPMVEGFEAELRTLGGRRFWAEISVRSLVHEGEPSLLISVQDVTPRRETEQRLRELATLDGLTGVFNRRHFYETAEPMVGVADRHHRPLSAAMIDVDHFKVINDEHGHDVGDEALRVLASTCRSVLRVSDVLARYGGEEFIVLLPETEADGARSVMERFRAALAAREVKVTDRPPVTIRVSIGIAEHQPGQGLPELLRRADGAMYAAKRAGRDRIETAPG